MKYLVCCAVLLVGCATVKPNTDVTIPTPSLAVKFAGTQPENLGLYVCQYQKGVTDSNLICISYESFLNAQLKGGPPAELIFK